jgi:hypothetical protein
MRDEMFHRDYDSGRNALNEGLDRLLAWLRTAIIQPFAVLEKIQFDAPWQRRNRKTAPTGRR